MYGVLEADRRNYIKIKLYRKFFRDGSKKVEAWDLMTMIKELQHSKVSRKKIIKMIRKAVPKQAKNFVPDSM